MARTLRIVNDDFSAARQDATDCVVTALLRWSHRCGGDAHCLVQLHRGAPSGVDPAAVVVVASELRDNPRGLGLTADGPGWAGAVLDQVVPRSVAPEHVRWLVRHGWYSTYDPAGPETLSEVELVWDGHRYLGDLAGQRLLPRAEARELAARWRLEPVDVALCALGQPAPLRVGTDGWSDLVAAPVPRHPIAASMLLTGPAGAVLLVEPTDRPGWGIPGGVVADGESPRAAAVREVGGELGITRTPRALLVVDHVPAAGRHTAGLALVFDGGLVDDPTALVLTGDKLRSCAFVATDRLAEHLPVSQTHRALAALRARGAGRTIYLEDGHPGDAQPTAGEEPTSD